VLKSCFTTGQMKNGSKKWVKVGEYGDMWKDGRSFAIFTFLDTHANLPTFASSLQES